jgi:hypothetical protein
VLCSHHVRRGSPGSVLAPVFSWDANPHLLSHAGGVGPRDDAANYRPGTAGALWQIMCGPGDPGLARPSVDHQHGGLHGVGAELSIDERLRPFRQLFHVENADTGGRTVAVAS